MLENRALISLIAVVAMCGCSRFVEKPISASRSLSQLEGRKLDLRKRWTLSALTAAAEVNNPELGVLRAAVKTADAALQTAGERPNPVLSFSTGYNSTTRWISPWIIEPGLDFTIETGGKRDARRAEAAARARVARLNLESGRWKVRAEIRRALLAIYAAEATGGQYGSQEAAQREATRLLELQLKEGAASPQDVAVARIPLNQTRLLRYDTDMQGAKARGQLAAAVGVPASALVDARLDFAEVTRLPSAPRSGVARRHALTHRADILAALSEYAATEERLRLEVAKQYPDLKLGPGYSLDQNENKWRLGIGFELPIFNQHKGAIAEAEGRREEAVARFVAVQARALAEIDIALAVYRAARAKADAAGALAKDVRAQTTAAETMKAAGEISQLDVSQRRVEQTAAELARELARLQALEAAAALEEALQTPATSWK